MMMMMNLAIVGCLLFSHALPSTGWSLAPRLQFPTCDKGYNVCDGKESCCPVGTVCTPSGCCQDGPSCFNPNTQNQPCTPGKSDLTCVACPNDNFYCPLSKTCHRDTSGKPECLAANTSAAYTTTTSTTSTSKVVTGTYTTPASQTSVGTTVTGPNSSLPPTTTTSLPYTTTTSPPSTTTTGKPSTTASGSPLPSSGAAALTAGTPIVFTIVALFTANILHFH